MSRELTEAPVQGLIRKMALPASIGFFFNTMYNVVDTYFGGQISTTALAAMIERLTRAPRDFQWRRHPLFDEMSERDWMRWGYLHVDHHLRQFGV